ncbi:hypothetical protein J2S74_005446 [Evansella vedderi]|uniref:Uncharacterized protein n=1 Tax=Evansella vedderi TaxID=38282 RepID=A0ABU0A3B8_9BACI|nr:hypothetical protein [Evansella vedderi]MDQ0257983.1 hypothetical protein [Evansella vedderi]
MDRDPLEKEPHLRKNLDEYHVDIPDFPMKRKKGERLLHFLASPTKDPFERMIVTTNGVLLLKVVPLMAAAVLTFLPLLFYL